MQTNVKGGDGITEDRGNNVITQDHRSTSQVRGYFTLVIRNVGNKNAHVLSCLQWHNTCAKYNENLFHLSRVIMSERVSHVTNRRPRTFGERRDKQRDRTSHVFFAYAKA